MNDQFIHGVIFDWDRIDNDSYLKKIEAFKGVEKLDFNKAIIQSNIRKEQISPKTSSFRGFLYIPINLSDTTKTHEISTVTNK
mgnify:CR=1 FL=1